KAAQLHPDRAWALATCLHTWAVALAQSDRDHRTDMVRHAGRTLASHACRDLVRVRQHSHLAVPPPALVLEALYLVSVSLAGLQDRPEPHSDASRSLRRSCFPREERLRLRPGPLCTGCHARRPSRGSCSLRGRELDVLQVTNRRLYSF